MLIEGGPRVLPPIRRTSRRKARAQLERLGVEVRTDARVTADRRRRRQPRRGADRSRVPSSGPRAWRPRHSARTLGVPLDRAGRVCVRRDLTIPGHDEVFVIGDLAGAGAGRAGRCPASRRRRCRWAGTPREHRWALARRARRPFRYRDKGSFATIGRGKAVGELRGRRQALRLPRLGRVAGDPHLLPDRLSQPGAGDLPVGVLLRHLPARRPPHHRGSPATAPVARRDQATRPGWRSPSAVGRSAPAVRRSAPAVRRSG